MRIHLKFYLTFYNQTILYKIHSKWNGIKKIWMGSKQIFTTLVTFQLPKLPKLPISKYASNIRYIGIWGCPWNNSSKREPFPNMTSKEKTECLQRALGLPPAINRAFNTIPIRGDRLCSPRYYSPPPGFSDLPTALLPISSNSFMDLQRTWK